MADVFSRRCGCGAVFALCSLKDRSTRCVGCQRKVAAEMNATRQPVTRGATLTTGKWIDPSGVSTDAEVDAQRTQVYQAIDELRARLHKPASTEPEAPTPPNHFEAAIAGKGWTRSWDEYRQHMDALGAWDEGRKPIKSDPDCPPGAVYFIPGEPPAAHPSALEQELRRLRWTETTDAQRYVCLRDSSGRLNWAEAPDSKDRR